MTDAAPPPPPPAPPTWPPPQQPPSEPPRRLVLVAVVALVIILAGGTGAVVLLVHRGPAGQATAARGQTPIPTYPPTQVPPPPAPPTRSPGDFTDPEGNFHVMFNGIDPIPDSTSFTISGQAVPVVEWGSGYAFDDSLDSVEYATFPAAFQFAPPRQSLSTFASNLAKSVQGKVLSTQLSTLQGFPSMDAILSYPPATVSAMAAYLGVRIVLAGHTLFVVESEGLENPPTNFPALAASLRILKHAP